MQLLPLRYNVQYKRNIPEKTKKFKGDNFCFIEWIPLPTLLNCDQSFAE